MSNLEDLNTKLEIVEETNVQESEKPSTSGMSGDRPPRRAGRRPGRRGGKMDERAKLERSRLSARECRARKKLRYQYLEDLVANREKAIFALRDELELYKQWCIQVDEGLIPLALLKLAQEDTSRDPDIKRLLSDVVVISDDEEESEESGTEESSPEADHETAGTSTSGMKFLLKSTTEVCDVHQASSRKEISMHENAVSRVMKSLITSKQLSEMTGLSDSNTDVKLSGASGSSSDALIKPGDRDIVWNAGAVKFGTLDANLEGIEESLYGVDVVENIFQKRPDIIDEDDRNTGASNQPNLPTIVEENEV